LSVQEAELSMVQRLGATEEDILIVQGNLANTYRSLGRLEEAISLRRDVYCGYVRIFGEEYPQALVVAQMQASTLKSLNRFEVAKSLLRKMLPVAQRVPGASNASTLNMRWTYAAALYEDTRATLDDLREAVSTLEDTERTARRVLGGAHPLAGYIAESLRDARAALSGAA